MKLKLRFNPYVHKTRNCGLNIAPINVAFPRGKVRKSFPPVMTSCSSKITILSKTNFVEIKKNTKVVAKFFF